MLFRNPMKARGWMICATSLALFAGACRKGNDGAEETRTEEVKSVVEEIATPPVATHLGFATRVPKDADLFLAGYHADEWLRGIVEFAGISADLSEEHEEEYAEVLGRLGDEHFVYVGAGAGRQIEMLCVTNRELSGSLAGAVVGSMLDSMADRDGDIGEPNPEDWLPDDLAERWIDVIVNEKRLQVPTVVIGWKPDAAQEQACLDGVRGWLDGALEEENVEPLTFEAHGGTFTGFSVSGAVVFREGLDKARAELAEGAAEMDPLQHVEPEQFERLLTALEELRFTVACGSVDGRVLLYVGNGAEGLRLADDPDESLAATPDFRWASGFAEHRQHAVMYLSEPLVRSVVPLLDMSAIWEALAAAVRDPIREQRAIRELLLRLADGSRSLAKRDASSRTIVCFEDRGLRVESRGGWPDPGLDYGTPLRMADATHKAQPVFRAHWVQNRERKDLEWRQVEAIGALVEAIANEFVDRGSETSEVAFVPRDVVRRAFREVRELNRAYRQEFRPGIGDEVAVFADLRGEIPPVPGVPEEVIRDLKAPRLTLARPVADRVKLEACGKSLEKSWRGLTAWAVEVSGENLPLIVPQSIESNGLTTWFVPAPFIGGDFLPGVSMNDEVWMVGTSRSMVSDFAGAIGESSTGKETGVVVDFDFAPVREWAEDLYRSNEDEAEKLLGESMARVRESGAPPPDVESIREMFNRFGGIRYRHWLDGGVPRSSVHFRFREPGE